MWLRGVGASLDDLGGCVPCDRVVHLVLDGRVEVSGHVAAAVVVEAALLEYVVNLLPDAALARAYVPDAAEELVEVVLAERTPVL